MRRSRSRVATLHETLVELHELCDARAVTKSVRRGDIRYWESETLDEHVALIKRQVDKSLEDDQSHTLAERIVNNDVGPREQLHAWGATFVVPSDGAGELSSFDEPAASKLALTRIWNFMSLNWSYIEDPESFDLFAHIRYGMNVREHAKHLTSLQGLDAEAQRMVNGHIARLRSVQTAGAGDCDDACIVLGTLLKAARFKTVRARVVSTDAVNWGHVYAVVGMPMRIPSELVALDPTVKGSIPGWEYERSKVLADFEL